MSSARDLVRLVSEVNGRWTHPAWLALVAGTTALEGLARLAPRPLEADPYSAYLAANGSPKSDTFMGRVRPRRRLDAAARIALGCARAAAALETIHAFDGSLPGQPLARALRFERGWLRRVELDGTRAAVFVTPRGRFVTELDDPERVARALGEACAGRASLPAIDGQSARAAVAVDLSPQPGTTARHLHRRAWTDAGGPWLGVGETEDLDLVTTCHLAIDGYGHGRVADRVLHGVESADPAWLARLAAAARSGLGDSEPRFDEAAPVAGALPIGFASEAAPPAEVTFARVAYALGRTVERLVDGSPASRAAPTFQVTVAPGARDDPDRRRRRVRFALMSLRSSGSEAETFSEFQPRLAAAVERERAQPGLLGRVLEATAVAPLPRALRRRLLASQGRPNRLVPPIAALAGRASLSLIRYPAGERPRAALCGASAPGLLATEEDPLGSFVVTIVHHEGGCTVSVDGTGVAGTDPGARHVLRLLLDEVAALSDETPGTRSPPAPTDPR